MGVFVNPVDKFFEQILNVLGNLSLKVVSLTNNAQTWKDEAFRVPKLSPTCSWNKLSKSY